MEVKWVPYRLGLTSQHKPDHAAFANELTELGNTGWRLIQVVYGNDPNHYLEGAWLQKT